MSITYTNLHRFLLLCFALITLGWVFQFLLISENLYIDFLSSRYGYERIQELLASTKKYEWTSYALTPVTYFVKISFVVSCLSLGYFFSDNQFKFNAFFRIAILTEFIFLLPILLKILWFLFVQTDYDFNDLQQFYALSLLSVFDIETLPKYFIYPLQTLNIFEVAYWFLLAYGVADVTGFSFKRSFGLVASSYGVGLVLWVVLVMFLTITYS